MKAPFPYFGGKTTIADRVWASLGNPEHYIEPFFGSGAVLLNRPNYSGQTETVNDKDGFICNVWRALQFAPDEVAKWCDWPVNHADLSTRRKVLIQNERRLLGCLQSDDEWYDAKLAGYWIWAASCWIGSGLTRPNAVTHISNSGMGINSKRPHIGNSGIGINARIPRISDSGTIPKEAFRPELYAWFRELQERLRNVRVVCGDWTRVCGGNWQNKMGTVGIFFDPPYGVEDRDDVYQHDSTSVAHDVADWCLEHGSHKDYRIVLCGYEEHERLLSARWTKETWKANGGYGNVRRIGSTATGKENSKREVIYYSPYCIGSNGQQKLNLATITEDRI